MDYFKFMGQVLGVSALALTGVFILVWKVVVPICEKKIKTASGIVYIILGSVLIALFYYFFFTIWGL